MNRSNQEVYVAIEVRAGDCWPVSVEVFRSEMEAQIWVSKDFTNRVYHSAEVIE